MGLFGKIFSFFVDSESEKNQSKSKKQAEKKEGHSLQAAESNRLFRTQSA